SFKAKSPEQYLKNPEHNGGHHAIVQTELPLEFVMNQLRLKQGFTAKHYQTVTGLNLDTLEPALSNAIKQGLLEFKDQHYRCSEKGWYFLDSILEKFIAE
ncbi:partial Heme chaperone HemW, partial [Patescibacteria group bacterium]